MVWTGTTNDGYPTMWFDGKMQLVRRVAYEHYHGPVPDGKVVTTTCGNKRCIAQAHLMVMTRTEATVRGFQHASRQPQPGSDFKLHLWEREEITDKIAAGVSVTALATAYNVSDKTIRRVSKDGKRIRAENEGRAVKTKRANAPRCVLCGEEFGPTSPERMLYVHRQCRNNSEYAQVITDKKLMCFLIEMERENRKEQTAAAVSADDLIKQGKL